MKISIVTVCFNSEATIRDAIDSVLAQRDVDFEHIVVDGASRDGTRAILAQYAAKEPRFRFVSEPDDGMYDAMNKGIAMATGDVVGILNADDLLETPLTLAAVARAFEAKPSLQAVYGDIRFVRNDLSTTVRYYSARHWRAWMHNWGYMPPHPGVYIRREVFSRLGPYKTDYRISADFELMTRYLCRNRISAGYLDACLVRMRMGGKSTRNWRANVVLNAENVRANRANGYFSCFAMMLPKYLFKIWGFVFKRGGALLAPRPPRLLKT